MNYFIEKDFVLKWLETPSLYNIRTDELYELDDESFEFIKKCSSQNGCASERNDFVDYCLDEGILITDKPLAGHSNVKKSPVPSLRYLELQITDRCNLRCGHCYIGGKGTSELPPDQISKILKEFKEMQGLRVLITGGEPLLHSCFGEINKILPDFALRKILFTNGLLLDKDILGKLNVEEIQVSIDGLENGHDSLRGRGAFRRTMAGVKLAMDAGFPVSVSTMVHPGNLREFEEMKILFRDLGIKDWTVDLPCIADGQSPELRVSPEEGGKYLGYGSSDGLHESSPGFACGLHLMSVMADGRAAKCTFYADRAAGRIEEGLAECWSRVRPVRLEELECDCEHLEDCRGGCRFRAELLGGPLGKDFYRCNLLLPDQGNSE